MDDTSTRDRIVGAADDLFYRQGYEQTSFAHIAEAVGITRGNFYHHFKSKDEMLDAVIGARLASTARMLEQWELDAETPRERIRSFIRILIANQSKIMSYGCPVGTLCTELAKLDHPAQEDASRLFTLFRSWLAQQFTRLGRRKDADELAMHLLAQSQGVSTLANTFRDREFVEREVGRMDAWLDALGEKAPRRPARKH